MNTILLFAEDFISSNCVEIKGRRLKHLLSVHKVQRGQSLSVGLANDHLGKGEVLTFTDQSITLKVTFEKLPPPALPIKLILALPRPKMFNRILQTAASMGVKSIYLINSYRVEKSFWQSPVSTAKNIHDQLILGLEQAKDTILPEVHLCKRFKPFVEDQLPAIIKGSTALVAHPTAEHPCPQKQQGCITLAIGPEGGFIAYEIEKFQEIGFTPITLGSRVLRVETAVPVLLAKLF